MRPAVSSLWFAGLLLGCGGGDPADDQAAPPDIPCEPLRDADFPEVRGRQDSAAHYFAAPWPDDSRKTVDGHIDVGGFPNPGGSDFLQGYLDVIGAQTVGWSANGAIYLPFDGPLHPASLPSDPEATLDEHSTVYLEAVDDPADRAPLAIRWQEEPTGFLPGNVLIAYPLLGHVLREATTYRAVASDRLRDAACRPVAAGAEAVFTTQAVIEPIAKMREAVHETPEPQLKGLRKQDSYDHVFVYEGTVSVPAFQDGKAPYGTEGGEIHWGDDGRPLIDHMEEVRVALAVPRSGTPRSGWPLVIYSHGTGGDYLGFVRNGAAGEMAQAGLASLGFDQVVHGDRVPPGSISPELAFVNLANIVASRDNMRQGAADGFQLMRLAKRDGGIVVKIDETFTRQATYTDPYRVLFLGHSQGAITGAPFVALEPDLLGAVFSGAGAVLRISLYERKDPIDFHAAAKQLMGLNSLDVDEDLDFFHPVPTLLQTFIDPADSVNFAPYFVLHDTVTKPWPTNTFVIQGLLDEQVTARTGAAFIAAAGVDLASPAPMPIPAMEARGQPPKALPFKQNIQGVTAGAVQWEDEDHFALFRRLEAKQKVYRFLESAAADEAIIAR